MQDGTDSVVVQLDSESDDVDVEDGTLSVGELSGGLSVAGPSVGELDGGLSVVDSSVTGGDLQLPMVINKILMHGR
jgi:hypothetical protein